MKRIFALLLFFICATSAASTFSPAVDQLINQIDPNINMGMMVVDLNTGETLYQRQAKQAFIPASNMKLFSDAAALLALGPDYRFQSKLSTDATLLDHGVLSGSVYLYLPGDPSLTQEHLNTLLSKLKDWRIARIHGDVVIASDHGIVNAYPSGWQPKDLQYSYGAPIAPVVLDENRLTVTVNPSYRVGQLALVELNLPKQGFTIDNQVKTSDRTKGCGVGFKMDKDNKLTVRGCIGLSQSAIQQRLAIQNPLLYSQRLIRLELSQLHIHLDGQVRLGVAPASSMLLATHDSKPISALMADTLKPSDNLYADSLYLHAAAKISGKPVNWIPAQSVLKNFLESQTGINFQQAVFTDGSGLSRNDLVTPEQTVGLLRFLHQRFPFAYEYIAALPIGGVDGTLQKRFRKPSERGMIRAKTGTMTGIIGLSGYLYTSNAHTLAFAIFVNTRPGTKPNVSGRYRSLVDSLCAFFLRQHPTDRNVVTAQTLSQKPVAFQQRPTRAEQSHARQAKWRGLEYSLKHALHGQGVNVLFRNDKLVLMDHNKNVNQVWSVLQSLRKKYRFSTALLGPSSPSNRTSDLLWIKSNAPHGVRIWNVRESS